MIFPVSWFCLHSGVGSIQYLGFVYIQAANSCFVYIQELAVSSILGLFTFKSQQYPVSWFCLHSGVGTFPVSWVCLHSGVGSIQYLSFVYIKELAISSILVLFKFRSWQYPVSWFCLHSGVGSIQYLGFVYIQELAVSSILALFTFRSWQYPVS